MRRGAELSTDHHPVVSWLRWQRKRPVRPGRPKRIMRLCCERLAESPVRRSFNAHLRESFIHVPVEAADIEPEWAMFCAFIVSEAMENDFWTALKRFWTNIRCLRMGKQCAINTVYGDDGALLTSPKDVVDRVCSNYRGITLFSLPGKVYSGVLERRVRRIVKHRI